MWRTHLVAGVASLWLLETTPLSLTRDEWALAIVGAMLGAMWPDLDASESKIRHLGWRLGRERFEPLEPVAFLVHRTLGHRGFLHSLGGWIVSALLFLPPSLWLGFWAWVGYVLGFGSHLFADALTRSGIPFWQLVPKRCRILRSHLVPPKLRIVTGSPEEEIYFSIFGCLAFALLFPLLFAPP